MEASKPKESSKNGERSGEEEWEWVGGGAFSLFIPGVDIDSFLGWSIGCHVEARQPIVLSSHITLLGCQGVGHRKVEHRSDGGHDNDDTIIV